MRGGWGRGSRRRNGALRRPSAARASRASTHFAGGSPVPVRLAISSWTINSSRRGRAVHRDDRRAAEAEVVLQGDLRVLHLPLLGLAAELPGELRALRQAGRAERMPL